MERVGNDKNGSQPMTDILKSTMSVGTFFIVLCAVCSLLIAVLTIYHDTEKREALELQEHIYQQKEFLQMKTQLTRIEAQMAELTATVKTYHNGNGAIR